MPPRDMIENSHIAALLSDPRQPDNPIVACNAAFEGLTGYGRHEILGRNCRFLRGPDTEAHRSAQLRESIRLCQPVLVDILNYRKDGTTFRNAVMVAPLFDAAGKLEFFLGSQTEVVTAPVLALPQASELAQDGLSSQASARARLAPLTARQRHILADMAAGKLNKQIAWELGLAERTVKMHRAAMFRALGVRSSAEAIRLAVEAGF